MERIDVDRRVLLAGVGGVVAGSLLPGRAQAAPVETKGPILQGLQAISDKVVRGNGPAQPCIAVQDLPGSDTAVHVISTSGSYYLSANIQGEPGKNGIEIRASNVDLDLSGFHILAAADPAGLASGAGILSDQDNVTIYDGTVVGWDCGVDFSKASRFLVWDVVSIGALSVAFKLGARGQAYDCDAYSAKVGFSAPSERTLVEEGGAWTCGVGFMSTGSQNLFLSNCATECPVPFDIGQGNAYGPIVVVSGDISGNPGSEHPSANLVY
jgi:hypothetical protein